MKKLTTTLLTVFILSSVVFSQALASVIAQTPPISPPISPPVSPQENFQINVVIKNSGNRVAGLEVRLSGNGQNESYTSTETADGKFTLAEAGTYIIQLILPRSSEYEVLAGTIDSATVTLTETNQTDDVNFLLNKKAPPVDENLEKIRSIRLPDNLVKIGSVSTKFTELDKTKLASVPNFIFDNPGVNKISYVDTLDLSNYNEYSKISLLANYLDLETRGKVKFNTELVPVFNKSAKVTMSGIKLVSWEDGKLAQIKRDNSIMSDPKELSYKNEELSFIVSGFSTYTVVPRLQLNLEGLGTNTLEGTDKTLKVYEVSSDSFKLDFRVDNLNSTITVINNGQPVNIPSLPSVDGSVNQTVQLVDGSNRFRVQVKLDNGEQVEEIFTINYSKPRTENNVSNLFAVVFFTLIIMGGVGVGIYYLRKRHLQAELDSLILPEVLITEPRKKYNLDLITPEEEKIYGTEEMTTEEIAQLQLQKTKDDKLPADN